MHFTVDDREFKLLVTGDRDSIEDQSWELWENESDKPILLLEVFYDEELNQTKLISYDPINLPLKVLEIVINDFKSKAGRDINTN